jgi:CHAD domain-containing protein
MHRKDLLHIIDKRFEALQANWGGLHDINKDAVHDWRVDYKKLRAILRLAAQLKKKLAIPPSLKDVYTISGEVRDRQMQSERMLQWFGSEQFFPPSYTQLLQQEITNYADELHPLTENDAVLQISHYKLKSSLPSRIPKKESESFLQQQLYEVRNILWLSYKKDDYLHSCRKHIKDLQYIVDIIGVSHFNAEKIKGLPPLDQIQSAAQELGNFNDQCVTMRFLSSSYLNRLPGEEKIILASLKSKLQKEKTRAKNKLVHSLELLFKEII